MPPANPAFHAFVRLPASCEVAGEPQRLTQGAAFDTHPELSTDGRKLVFSSNRSGNYDVWVRDWATGAETALTITPSDETIPAISRDGSKVSFWVPGDAKYMVPVAGGAPDKIAGACVVLSWSLDGKTGLCSGLDGITLFDMGSGRKTKLTHSNVGVPLFSPDDRWITFVAPTVVRSRVYVVPFRSGPSGAIPIPESEWIAITSGDSFEDKPRWSPDGNVLYFTSDRDGFRCI